MLEILKWHYELFLKSFNSEILFSKYQEVNLQIIEKVACISEGELITLNF